MSYFEDWMMKSMKNVSAMEEAEVPRHKKKKLSSISKSRTKAKHKHRYKECLFNKDGERHKGKYCTICGKIGDIDLFNMERMSGGCWRQMSETEVLEKYKHLEQVEVEDFFQKFLVIRSGKAE